MFAVESRGFVVGWDCGRANVYDKLAFQNVVGEMVVFIDTGFVKVD